VRIIVKYAPDEKVVAVFFKRFIITARKWLEEK